MLSLWTIATKAATVFKIIADGSKKTLRPLYGALRGILVSDRTNALNFWAMERRQICWARECPLFRAGLRSHTAAGAPKRNVR